MAHITTYYLHFIFTYLREKKTPIVFFSYFFYFYFLFFYTFYFIFIFIFN